MSGPTTRYGTPLQGSPRAYEGLVSLAKVKQLARARELKRIRLSGKKDFVEKYAVPVTERKKLWSLLNTVAKILNLCGIDYFVAWGLLLGIQRGGDFIAHDDDVDVVLNSPLELFLRVDWKSFGITIYMPAPGDDWLVSVAFATTHAREFPFIEFYSPTFDESTATLASLPTTIQSVPLSPYRKRPILLSMPSGPEAVHVFLQYWYGPDYATVVTVYPTHRPWAKNTPVGDNVANWPAFSAKTGAPKGKKRKRRQS
jgi:hypothetical protein